MAKYIHIILDMSVLPNKTQLHSKWYILGITVLFSFFEVSCSHTCTYWLNSFLLCLECPRGRMEVYRDIVISR